MIKYGILHCHSENSLHDSPMHVKTLLERAKELGAPAVALTDHDTMMGIDEFMDLGMEMNINTIPGIEMSYYMDREQNPYLKIFGENQGKLRRNHLIIMAKDMDGYKALIKAVKMSNYHQEKNAVKTITYNLIDNEMLMKCFGPGTSGHGHVIATSACINGPVASILLYDMHLKKYIGKLYKEQQQWKQPAEEYLGVIDNIEKIENKLKILAVEKSHLAKVIKKNLSVKKKNIEEKEAAFIKESLYEDSYELLAVLSDDYAELHEQILKERNLIQRMKADLDIELKEQESAKIRLKEINNEESNLKNAKSALSIKKRELKGIYDKYQKIDGKIEAIEEELKGEEQLYQIAYECAKNLNEIFGAGDFYIELQNHYIEEEKYCMPLLVRLSQELSIPIVAANDCHIPYNTEDCLKAREILRFNYFKSHNERIPGDKELYIKNDEELYQALSDILPVEIVQQAMENIGVITSQCHVIFPKEEHYPKYRGNSYDDFLRFIEEGKNKKIANGILEWTDEYQKKLEHEIPIIRDMGFVDYHLIVRDYVEYSRKIGVVPKKYAKYIPEDTEKLDEWIKENNFSVGIGCGPGRGSAAGSLVCYLLGITNIDPIKYGLLFERFLNPERVTMPDIDFDIRTSLRPYVIRYLKWRYGKNAVCSIMTKGKLQAKNAILLAGRDLADQLFGKKDSAEKKVISKTASSISKMIPNVPNIKLSDCMNEINDEIKTWEQRAFAETICKHAKLIEGYYTSTGMHAGGIIISDNDDINEYIPLAWNQDEKDETRSQWTTQCDMIQAEAKGLLKMDVLGLNTLDICTDCAQLVWETKGIRIDFDLIPFETEVFSEIYAQGNTSSVFQFESEGMKNMLKDFKPESIEDIILLIAAYRPGPMQYLDDIIQVKNRVKKAAYLIPELEPILSNTYGSVIYQEQVQQIFQKLAGYSLGQADLVRRAMSKKKLKVLEVERASFIHGDEKRNIKGCEANGIDVNKANQLFDQLLDFAKYAFNKSHAAAYAIVSYQTAYLKYHFPTEYLCSMFNNKDVDAFGPLFLDCRLYNIEILPPDINRSYDIFTVENGKIRYGLKGIKGINEISDVIRERQEKKQFNSIYNFFFRCPLKKNTAENLIKAGSFDSLYADRSDILKHITEICDESKNAKYKKKYNSNLPKKKTDYFMEKEVLGTFLSGSPLENYGSDSEYGCIPINEAMIEKKYAKIFGMISDLTYTKRKKDMSKMAIFTLTGKTDNSVKILCMDDVLRQQDDLIQEGAVICIEGSIKADDDGNITLFAKKVSDLKKNIGTIVVALNSAADWENIKVHILPYTHDGEYELVTYLKDTCRFRKTVYSVTEDILKSKKIECRRL